MMVTSSLLFGKLAEVERWLHAKSIFGFCLNIVSAAVQSCPG